MIYVAKDFLERICREIDGNLGLKKFVELTNFINECGLKIKPYVESIEGFDQMKLYINVIHQR